MSKKNKHNTNINTMTPNEIKAAEITRCDLLIAQYGGDTVLDQAQLDNVTDTGVTLENAINPNSTRPVIRS